MMAAIRGRSPPRYPARRPSASARRVARPATRTRLQFPPPAASSPYAATTNSDIIVSQSFNGGQTWSAPAAIAVAGDQFMPWGAYAASGKLRIGYFDRSYDPANHMYGYTLATETSWGSL